MTRDDLLEYLLDHGAHPLRPDVSAWIGSSRRFAVAGGGAAGWSNPEAAVPLEPKTRTALLRSQSD